MKLLLLGFLALAAGEGALAWLVWWWDRKNHPGRRDELFWHSQAFASRVMKIGLFAFFALLIGVVMVLTAIVQ